MTPIYYQRELGPARAIANEIFAISILMHDAFEIAREVTRLLPEREGGLQEPDVHFHVNRLFLQHILQTNASKISERTPTALSAENITHLNQFLQDADVSSISFDNPYASDVVQQNEIVKAVAMSLQTAYLAHTNRFIKQKVPLIIQDLSCFDYVIYNAGLYKKFLYFKHTKILLNPNWQFTASDYIGFLEMHMAKAMLPFQPNDIILYFDSDHEFQHAAIVTENTQLVYAKFGNENPFAYLHDEIETPSLYGTQFQIYRK